MLYNNSEFGKITKALIENLFNRSESQGELNPPPPTLYLIDDSEAFLLDDSGSNLTTD